MYEYMLNQCFDYDDKSAYKGRKAVGRVVRAAVRARGRSAVVGSVVRALL